MLFIGLWLLILTMEVRSLQMLMGPKEVYVVTKSNLLYASRLTFVRNGMGRIFWLLVPAFLLFVVLSVHADFVKVLNKKALIIPCHKANKGKERSRQ